MSAPEKTIDVLTAILEQLKESPKQRKWPQCMPHDPAEAARWWMGIVEPPKDYEKPRRKKAESTTWVTPYTDRVVYTLVKFFKLTTEEQETVVSCREDKVYWRGDDIDLLMRVYDETMEMRRIGVEAYRKKALSKMREAFSNFGRAA